MGLRQNFGPADLCACAVHTTSNVKMEGKISFDLNFVSPSDEAAVSKLINDSQLGPDETLFVPGPYVNQDPTLEELDSEQFTQQSNERFYTVSDGEIEFIASQATAQSTKHQTKWAVKIFTGK